MRVNICDNRKKSYLFSRSIGIVLLAVLLSLCGGFKKNKDNIVYANEDQIKLTENKRNLKKDK